jgi:hypothetical protein
MRPKSFLLRVFSVRRTGEKQEIKCPTPEMWEVRADTDLGYMEKASLFYYEGNPRNLPPLDSLIHVTIDDRLTEETTTIDQALDKLAAESTEAQRPPATRRQVK